MARRTRSTDLEHFSNRLALPPRGKPYSVMIGPRLISATAACAAPALGA